MRKEMNLVYAKGKGLLVNIPQQAAGSILGNIACSAAFRVVSFLRVAACEVENLLC